MTQEITLGKQTFKLPYADLLPSLSEDEYNALRTDIIARGIVVPVVIDEHGSVIDGQHRLRIAASLDLVDVPMEVRPGMSEAEREALALDLNLHRRHLSSDQLKTVILWRRDKGESYRQIAEAVGVDVATAWHAVNKTGVENSTPETPKIIKGKDGKRYPAKQKPRTKPKRIRTDTVAQAKKTIKTLNEVPGAMEATNEDELKRIAREHNRQARLFEISEGNTPLDTGGQTYPVIYADPPWSYDFTLTDDRAIENHYPTMTIDDICALPVGDIAAPDCALFLWATSPKLPEAMRVIEAWGFTYKTCMVWVKDKIGMGYYARQKHELLLIATRGDIPPPGPSDRPDSVIEAPRLEHSAKPTEFYEAIERMYPTLDKIEMFSRTPREGWQAWGNQVGETTRHDSASN